MQWAPCDPSSACLENVGLLIFQSVSRSPTFLIIIIDNSIWCSHGNFYVGVSWSTWKDPQLYASPSCPALQLHLHNGLSSQITHRLKQPPSLLSKSSNIFLSFRNLPYFLSLTKEPHLVSILIHLPQKKTNNNKETHIKISSAQRTRLKA